MLTAGTSTQSTEVVVKRLHLKQVGVEDTPESILQINAKNICNS